MCVLPLVGSASARRNDIRTHSANCHYGRNDVEADRNALCKSHPGECRIYRRQELRTIRIVLIRDSRRGCAETDREIHQRKGRRGESAAFQRDIPAGDRATASSLSLQTRREATRPIQPQRRQSGLHADRRAAWLIISCGGALYNIVLGYNRRGVNERVATRPSVPTPVPI